jgi:hypothetical protein
MPVDWSKFSTSYSLQGYLTGKDLGFSDLEELGDCVHRYWIKGVEALWSMIDAGYTVEGGYPDEKRKSHSELCIPYQELSRENQLKDIYVIKQLVDESTWKELGGEEYEDEFVKYDIGW